MAETVPVTEVIGGYLGEEGENIPTAVAASDASSTPTHTTSNDDNKSDDAYDIVIGGGPALAMAAY